MHLRKYNVDILRVCELKVEPTAVIQAILARIQNHHIHLPLPGHGECKNLADFPRYPPPSLPKG